MSRRRIQAISYRKLRRELLAEEAAMAPVSLSRIDVPQAVLDALRCLDCNSAVQIGSVSVFHDDGCPALKGVT
jgi:hypothetical protein